MCGLQASSSFKVDIYEAFRPKGCRLFTGFPSKFSHLSLFSHQLWTALCPPTRQVSMQHDAASTMFDGGDSMCSIYCSVQVFLHMAFYIQSKNLWCLLTWTSSATCLSRVSHDLWKTANHISSGFPCAALIKISICGLQIDVSPVNR